jgi:hypothetical protein
VVGLCRGGGKHPQVALGVLSVCDFIPVRDQVPYQESRAL